MKKIIGSIVLIFALALVFIQMARNSGTVSSASVAVPDPEASYCLAIRGNGELEPAHWGGMARTVEKLGLPQAMAGGSSASISMFWLNAMAAHPQVQSSSPAEQKLRASLLIKSLLGFFAEIQKTPQWQNLLNLYGQYQLGQSQQMTADVAASLIKNNYAQAMALLNQGIDLGLIDKMAVAPVLQSLGKNNTPQAQFYVEQMKETLSVFGKFDATHDDNLFFRTGVVSFENVAVTFGRVAGFYAAAGNNSDVMNAWTQFFSGCAEGSEGLSWVDLMKQKPVCGSLFHDVFAAHFKLESISHLEELPLGSPIKAFPTTAVLADSAATQAETALAQYPEKMDAHFGKDFKITNPEDIHFGYWGESQDLLNIAAKLNPSDEKSRRFLALGSATWKQVLSLSPAEPGLSPIKKFSANGKTYYSAGGWSDLHPVSVLKASGCENIVYITRQGGESLFAQGVAKRLLNLDRDWTLLTTSTPEESAANHKLNNAGDPTADPKGLWSKLYNLANPASSINNSLSQASAVLCTNWDAFDVAKDLVGLVEDSYRSPYWVAPAAKNSFLSPLGESMTNQLPGCQPLAVKE